MVYTTKDIIKMVQDVRYLKKLGLSDKHNLIIEVLIDGQATRYKLKKETDINWIYLTKYLSDLMAMGLVIEPLPGIYKLND